MRKQRNPAQPKIDGPIMARLPGPPAALEASFAEVVGLIQQARQRAFQAVNTELIDLYWRVGEYISRKLEVATWGEGVVDQLARYIAQKHPDIKGFTRWSLFRMRQFYETYRYDKKLAPLVRQLSWTHNLLTLSRCKRSEEREFYLRLCQRKHWGKRELERQLAGALFERTVLSPPKVSPPVAQLHPENRVIGDVAAFMAFRFIFDIYRHCPFSFRSCDAVCLSGFVKRLALCYLWKIYSTDTGGNVDEPYPHARRPRRCV